MLAQLLAPRAFHCDGTACYSPHPMKKPVAPLQPVWWRFAVSVTCAVTLLLVVVGVADVWVTLQG